MWTGVQKIEGRRNQGVEAERRSRRTIMSTKNRMCFGLHDTLPNVVATIIWHTWVALMNGVDAVTIVALPIIVDLTSHEGKSVVLPLDVNLPPPPTIRPALRRCES